MDRKTKGEVPREKGREIWSIVVALSDISPPILTSPSRLVLFTVSFPVSLTLSLPLSSPLCHVLLQPSPRFTYATSFRERSRETWEEKKKREKNKTEGRLDI